MYRVRRKNPAVLLVLTVALSGCDGIPVDPEAVDPLAIPPSMQKHHAEPEVFAPGIISSNQEEYRITFTPDGKTAYFGRAERFFPASRQAWIYETHLLRGEWTTPVVASFSGKYSDIDPFVSHDGRRLYFSSIRPVDGVPRLDLDTWMVERTPTGWSEPVNLGPIVNSPFDDLYPSVDARGTLYVASTRPHAPGAPRKWNIWRSTLDRGGYQPAERLGSAINSDDPAIWEFNPTITQNGRTLLFTRLNLADPSGTGFGEIQVSHLERGEWLPAVNVGAPVNTELDEFHPSLSPNGQTLYFARRDPLAPDAQGDLYSVAVKALGWPLR
jgi:hypothetical protein